MNFFRRKDYDGEREVVDMPRLERDITGPPPAEYLPARARLDLLLEGQKIAVETIKAYHRRTTDELVSTLEHHEKVLATMRRDLDIDCDPAELVLAPPDRSQLTEMFRRFEFRGLLQRVDQLDEALPAAAPRAVEGETLPWQEADDPSNTVLQALERGSHADGWPELWAEMTEVRRSGPGATW